MKPHRATEQRRTINAEHMLTSPEFAADRAAHRRQFANAPELHFDQRITAATKRGPFTVPQLIRHAEQRGTVILTNGLAVTLKGITEHKGHRARIIHDDGRTERTIGIPEIAVLVPVIR